jgi:hypothetical protein
MDTTTILPVYHKCDVCNYTSILKANYDRHLLTKKHLKNIEKHIEKIDSSLECLSTPTSQEESDKSLDDNDSSIEGSVFEKTASLNPQTKNGNSKRVNLIQEDRNFDKDEFLDMLKAPRESWAEYRLRERNEERENITISKERNDIFYATKIYNTLFELKRQYPNKYQFVRNTNRMKREWERWSQEQYDCDYMYCYTKWFKGCLQVNNELISKFVF